MTGDQDPILLVDDEEAIRERTARLLSSEGFGTIRKAGDGEQALATMETENFGLVILDLGLPGLSGEQVLHRLKQDYPAVPVIIVTALGDVETAVRCMGSGAYDYLVKGGDPRRLVASVRRALNTFRQSRDFASVRERMLGTKLRHPEAFEGIVTNSERMRAHFRFIEAVAETSEPVLIQGETGTGKELFAQAIHKASGVKGPFVAINLGGLDDLMVTDTLFGHTKGAYTGADDTRKGLVASAEKGTLFLDEIGELALASQVKLLRFLEDRQYFPLGSDQLRRSDARIVLATNRDLAQLTEDGKFRKDLLYRVSTFRVDVPPLRERPEDLGALCQFFLATLSPDRLRSTLSSGALALLASYPFPGNVRELRSLLLRAAVGTNGGVIDRSTLLSLLPLGAVANAAASESTVPFSLTSELPTIRQAVDELITEALRRTEGHQLQAASLLGISPQALNKRLKKR